MLRSIVFLEIFEKVSILFRKRVSLFADVRAELAHPRHFKLEILNVSFFALAMGSTTRLLVCMLASMLNKERRTSVLACSSQPKERTRALF
jgi:hypothetical protein